MKPKRIRCNTIAYRQGFIEITPGIHKGCINIETWQALADLNISDIDIRSHGFPENGVAGNTELELDAEKTKELIALLRNAVAKIESG